MIGCARERSGARATIGSARGAILQRARGHFAARVDPPLQEEVVGWRREERERDWRIATSRASVTVGYIWACIDSVANGGDRECRSTVVGARTGERRRVSRKAEA